ncbi:uncharacterized protein LOC131029713 isoform X2 [Cryptomeria japonica]|uniref:uncharacterized protein LOC131029713 isoform X2 n=1 Tax=Cryptomeria japonica TaxID=3369 RepID=UPI0025AC254C|nr:uncharacterized protein LOC131029713 isoform X2 [Cryptomeria japonica]
MNLTGKNVLLTSNGDEVSFNLALNLCKTGCSSAERLKNYVNGSIVGVAELDMSSTESVVDEAIHKAWRSLGHIDALVNCYAYEGNVTPPLDVKEDELDKIIRLNLKGTWLVCKAVGKRMRDNAIGGSFILLTTIIGGERGLYPGASAYGACLAGVNHLARALAMELGKYKIRVNAVARGLHDSDAFLQTFSEDKKEKSVKDIVPLQRWLDVKNDLTSIVLYLVADDSSFMTGTVIYIDGGQSIVRPRMRSYM